MLPGLDGLEVMRRVRAEDRSSAIILLTAKGEESDRIIGLRLGADDYVVKPFSPAELVARVDAVLRRVDTVGADEPPLRFGELEIDPARAARARRRAEEVAADRARVRPAAVPRPPPGPRVHARRADGPRWQYAFYTDTSTVTVHIRRLRAKLEPDPETPRWIETVWGVGYRFAAVSGTCAATSASRPLVAAPVSAVRRDRLRRATPDWSTLEIARAARLAHRARRRPR